MRTKIIVLICSLLVFFCSGCQLKDEGVEENNNLTQEQQEVDLEALREEYGNLMLLLDELLFIVSDEEMTVQTAIDALQFVQENKIEPTQPQTKEINAKMDEIINLGIKYMITGDESKKAEIRNEITNNLNEIQEIMIEIEALLLEYKEV